MKLNSLCVCSALVLAVGATACTKSSPTRPTDSASAGTTASVTDATSGITITTPTPASPADGARFKFTDQPITLTINNAAATGGTITYSFQVASDAAFATVVFSKDGVAAGAGTTSVKIDSPKLAGNKDYYWRARAVSGGATGAYSKGRAFNVGPEVVLNAPAPVAPANGGQSSGSPPSFTVNNATRTGPAGTIAYSFSISDSAGFGTIIASNVVNEGPGQTTATIDARLTPNQTYYWRAQAIDQTNGVTGPFSPTWSFKFVPFDMRQAVIHDNPPDVASWPETAKITMVNFTGGAFDVDFDKRDGPDHWPEAPFGDGGIEYTLGLCANLGGTWHCSAVVQFWYGRELEASTPPSYVGRNWFYDGRWGALNGYQPQNGEQIGIWVGAGNLRGQAYTAATCPRICERSNVQMVEWHNDDQALFTFSLPNGRTLGLRRR
ncbi:MAG TPA: hypothetical protein VFB07_05185 [Vicinamibacterales bacterium]|nr:hypothetical protein [Vicinamibacterales bacterium]